MKVFLVILIMVLTAVLVYLIRTRGDAPPDIKDIEKPEDIKKETEKTIKEHNEQLEEDKKEIKEKPKDEVLKEFDDMYGSD